MREAHTLALPPTPRVFLRLSHLPHGDPVLVIISVRCQVREHPTKGPFVEGALTATVSTARETERLLVEGQARRAVAGTNMNDASSRSHAIFTIVVTKVELDLKTGAEGLTTSKVKRGIEDQLPEVCVA